MELRSIDICRVIDHRFKVCMCDQSHQKKMELSKRKLTIVRRL